MKKILIGIGILFVIGIVMAAVNGDDTTETSSNTGSNSNDNAMVEDESSNEQVMQEASMQVVTADFIAEFDKNQLAAEEKYAEKIVELTAYIDNISEDIMGDPFLSLKPVDEEYYFDPSVQCTFKDTSALTSLENGQSVTVRGKVSSQSLGIISIKDCEVVQ